MYNVKLAPLKGLTKDDIPQERLQSLTELMLTDPIIPNSSDLVPMNDSIINSVPNFGQSDTIEINSGGDSNHHTTTTTATSLARDDIIRSSPRINQESSKLLKVSPLGLNDVNSLWTVYLNQQQGLGGLLKLVVYMLGTKVDISDKQAMAKSYQDLDADQVQVLRDLREINTIDLSNKSTSKRKTKSNHRTQKEAPRKAPAVVPKSVNKRQQRKKKIRDELKRQLSTLTALSETEGFPWKAIVSKSGFRDLKLVGWPRAIPRLKRIDDFNPNELNLFEEGLDSGTIKIVKKKNN